MATIAAARHANPGVSFGRPGPDAAVIPAPRIEPGTLCIVVRDARSASLVVTIVEVVGHVDGARTAALLGDHLIETRHGDRYVTWGGNLRPINPPPAGLRVRREPMREAA